VIGQTVSHYRILEKLGGGGMGVVYRAEDTRLHRSVALKFLPERRFGDPSARERFEREAEAASALSHPHICTVHDIGEHEGQPFLVMEHLQGRTLQERIGRRPLATPEILELGLQIADALDAAHGRGIVHRDIKPANIFITDRGDAKVLDFGLAKPAPATAESRAETEAAPEPLTSPGTALGTVSYMSPEQVLGKPLDGRSDLFSLGAVLYEMATGTMAFPGETTGAVFDAILHKAPASALRLNPELPAEMERVISKCLEKERELRYQNASDLRADLKRLRRDTSSGESATVAAPRARRPRLWYGFGGLLLSVMAVAAYVTFGRVSSSSRTPRLTNPRQVTTSPAQEDYPTWRPDGTQLAYESDEAGEWDIWVSQVPGGASVNLTRDVAGNARWPSWSPDGSQIAFRSDREGGGTFVMPALGGSLRKVGPSVALSDGPPQWSPDGKRLARSGWAGEEYPYVEVVSLEGGPTETFRIHAGQGDPAGFELSWSADGRFLAYGTPFQRVSVLSEIWVTDAHGGAIHRVVGGDSFNISPSWSKDGRSLFFVSNRGGGMDLWRQRLTGDAEPVGPPEAVTTGLEGWFATPSRDGTKLAVAKRRAIASLWRVPVLDHPAGWRDAVELTFQQGLINGADLFPDGSGILLSIRSVDGHFFWRMPMGGGGLQRVVREPMSHYWPRFSPDGGEIAFQSEKTETKNIWVVPVSGGPARQVTHTPAWGFDAQWSPDGRLLAYSEGNPSDIWVVPASGGVPRRLTDARETEASPRWSPDGRQVAFVSLRPEGGEIWITSVEGGSPRRLAQGATWSTWNLWWSSDGQWILFESSRGGQNQVWRVPAAGGEPSPVTPLGAVSPVLATERKTLHYARTDGSGRVRLFRSPATGGPERLLAELEARPGRFGGLAASDGRFLYFTWQQTFSDIWVMDVSTP
jgi:Tol biopolymer transport system component